ncbi:MAG TPA: DUF456 domain-containing protein [Myxococcota bacterium]|nr:DUF456 domain-containing protein [Myxococcota bacterium]
MEDGTWPLLVLAGVLVVVGLVGTVLPAIPGVPLIFVGLFLAAWAEGFQYVGAWTLVILGALALLGYGVDFVAGAFGARKFGASRLAVIGAMIGTVVGLFLGIPGILVGPFVGAAAGELVARRDVIQAGRAGFGTWLGLVVGAAVKIAISFSMVAVFLAARVF